MTSYAQQSDPEKGGIQSENKNEAIQTSTAYYNYTSDAPPAQGTKKTVTIFGKQYPKKTVVIISAAILALVAVFAIGLGAGIGVSKSGKKSGDRHGVAGPNGDVDSKLSSGGNGDDETPNLDPESSTDRPYDVTPGFELDTDLFHDNFIPDIV